MQASSLAVPHVAVLLGASNLAMGLPTVLEVLGRSTAGPIRVFAARGHGRSYAKRSRVLLRDLPGILESGLWTALADDMAGKGSGPDALITDVGNDLVYGATPDELLGWVEECLDRLDRVAARPTITGLPVMSLRRLSRTRFEVIRRLLFPAHPLRLERMLEMVAETDERLAEIAARRGIPLVPMALAWYGLDPVHFRIGRRRHAWETILAGWAGTPASAPPPENGQAHSAAPPGTAPGTAPGTGQAHSDRAHSDRRFRGTRRAKPARWWFAGRERSNPQPARRAADGSELWLF